MMIWGLVDSQRRLCALNPNVMYGCTDWEEIETDLTAEDPIADSYGACLYKVIAGKLVARTDAERANDISISFLPENQTDEKSAEERISAVEADIALMESAYKEGVNDA